MYWHLVNTPTMLSSVLEEEGTDEWYARNVIVEYGDSLGYGPSSTEPALHARMREDYWHGIYQRAKLPWSLPPAATLCARELEKEMNTREADDSFFVWIGLEWERIIFFWWAVDAFNRIGVLLDQTSLFFTLPEGPHRGHDWRKDRRPMRRVTWDYCLRCWAAFCGNDPIHLMRALDDPDPLHREVSGIFTKEYLRRFPRRDGQTEKLQLSDTDRSFLSSFDPDEWRLMVRAIDGDDVTAMTLARLYDWVEGDELAALETRRNPDAVNPFMNYFFRLTPYGERLLEEGIPDGATIPRDPCGGLVFHDPDNVWVLDGEGEAVKL